MSRVRVPEGALKSTVFEDVELRGRCFFVNLHRFESSIICFKHSRATIYVQPQNQCLQAIGAENSGRPANKKRSVNKTAMPIKNSEVFEMRKERRTRKQMKYDLMRSYSGMEAKVSQKAKDIFKRKPYAVAQ